MDNVIQDLPSIGSIRLALHGLAGLRKITAEKIEAGDYDADEEELDYQVDRVERLALAINEVATFYERLCEAHPSEPSVDTILKEYL